MSTREYVYNSIELLDDEQIEEIAEMIRQFSLPAGPPQLDMSRMTKEEFDAELQKGIDDFEAGRVVPYEKVREELFSVFDFTEEE